MKKAMQFFALLGLAATLSMAPASARPVNAAVSKILAVDNSYQPRLPPPPPGPRPPLPHISFHHRVYHHHYYRHHYRRR